MLLKQGLISLKLEIISCREIIFMKKIYQFIVVSFLSVLLSMGLINTQAQATGIYDLPTVNAGESVWVIDQADTLSRSTEGALENTLSNLAKKTGNEVRMVAIRRLDYGETIDTFIDGLFDMWFPTPEEKANQTLVVMDTLSNRSAIRSGEAAAENLPPEISESITDETISFALKDLQYNQALLNASDRLVAVLSGQEDPGPPEIKEISAEGTFATAEETDDQSATVWVVVLLIVATVIPMVTYFWYVGFPGS